MSVKKTKRKRQTGEQFKQIIEQNDKIIKTIAKSTSKKNEIQRQKVDVQRMKQEYKILFANLSSITDLAARVYIENEKAIILRRKVSANIKDMDKVHKVNIMDLNTKHLKFKKNTFKKIGLKTIISR